MLRIVLRSIWVLGLVLEVILANPGVSRAPTSSPAPIRVTPETAANSQYAPVIAVAPDLAGHFYAAWIDRRNGQATAFLTRSTDAGQTWGANVRISDIPAAMLEGRLTLAAGGAGQVYAAWMDIRTDPACDGSLDTCASGIYLARSSDDGQTWHPSQRIDDPAQSLHASSPSLALDGEGRLYVAWYESELGLIFARSLDQGSTWSDPQSVGLPESRSPRLTAGSDGVLDLLFITEGNVYLIHSNDLGQSWSAAQRVDDDTSGASQSQPALSRDPQGNLYAAWLDARNGANDIYMATSTDQGSTWGTNHKVNIEVGVTVSTFSAPSVSATEDAVHIAWEGTARIFVSTSTDQGANWLPGVQVNNPASTYNQSPALTIDPTGVLCTLWTDFRNKNYDIYAARSTTGGSTWEEDQRLHDETGIARQYFPALAPGTGNNLFLAWWETRPDQNHIYVSHSLDGGVTWQEANQVEDSDQNPAWGSPPALDVAVDNDLYIAWVEYQGGVYIKFSQNMGVDWSPPITVTDDSNAWAVDVSMIIDPQSQDIYLAWADNRQGDYNIYATRSTDGGQSWSPNRLVNDDLGVASQVQPVLALNAGTLYLAWVDARNGDPDVYFSHSNDQGQSWVANQRINDDGQSFTQNNPALALAADGTLYLAWNDGRAAAGIWLSSSVDGGVSWSANIPVDHPPFGIPSEGYPSLATTPDGALYLAFSDSAGRNYPDIYLLRSIDGGGAWSTSALLNPLDQAAQSDAELAVLEDGSLAVAWSDLRHGAENIYASPISIESQVPPAAAFYAAPVAGGPGLAVTFQDQSSGWVGSWAWSFGDGGSSTLPDPLHTYIEAGSYSVSLTVAGPWGTDALNQPDLITIHQPPQADFGAAPQSGSAPLQVSFSNLSTGYTDSWWDFGDGLTSTLPHPTHAYTSPGFYTVTLIVDGPGGSDIEIKSDYIAVFDLPSIYLPVIQKP